MSDIENMVELAFRRVSTLFWKTSEKLAIKLKFESLQINYLVFVSITREVHVNSYSFEEDCALIQQDDNIAFHSSSFMIFTQIFTVNIFSWMRFVSSNRL